MSQVKYVIIKNMEEIKNVKNKKTNLVLVGVGIICAFVLGFYVGNLRGQFVGKIEGEKRYKDVVEAIYPKPPKELYSTGGVIKSIYGAKLEIESYDPLDYLPHADGSERRKKVYVGILTPKTKFVLVDKTKYDKNGYPSVSAFQPSDLKVGDNIAFESGKDLLKENNFEITKVVIEKY